ncbi:DMT family transporter [Tabrizicola sp. J26]|uniref:DMT family transporter n=1 Tax=Alitabrizicola rongguiensis TaxID=2909234 RepID=UPI001F1A1D06|nr:DMT family transporter [Tabrizicola rongguiensis]MCF1709710.1 DMT family transporter [Tabrizicola rongguiensis]
MPRKDRLDAVGIGALIAISTLLAFNQIVVKVVNAGLQPVFFAGLRSALAVVSVLAWMRFRGISHRIPRATLPAALSMGVAFAAEFLCLFIALDLTTVVRAAILFYTMPLWFSLLAHFFLPGERITALKATGLIFAFAGTAWAILDKGSSTGSQASFAGDLCALGGAFGWAMTAFLARGSAMGRERPETQLFWMVLVSGPILILVAPAFGPLVRDIQPLHIWGLLFQAVVVVTGGFVAWLWVLSVYPASTVASFSFLTPIFGMLLGWILLGEPIGPGILGAAALVAVGIILINRRPALPEN